MATTLNASNSGSGGLIQTADASGVLALQTAGVTAVTVDTSQNVGIGTTSPAVKLDVVGGINTTSNITTGNGAAFVFGTATTAYMSGSSTSNNLTYFTASTERMRIDSSGNVLLNTTSTNNNEKMRIKNGNDSRAIAFQSASSAECGYIYINAGGTGTTYSTSSDYRLKEDIAPMTGALAKVAQLKPVTYKWKINGSDGQGFIAHELAEVVPDCVTGDKDAVATYTDENGNEATRPAYQGIDTSFLVATLTAAIQEQQALITSLTARIAALEGAPA